MYIWLFIISKCRCSLLYFLWHDYALSECVRLSSFLVVLIDKYEKHRAA